MTQVYLLLTSALLGNMLYLNTHMSAAQRW